MSDLALGWSGSQPLRSPGALALYRGLWLLIGALLLVFPVVNPWLDLVPTFPGAERAMATLSTVLTLFVTLLVCASRRELWSSGRLEVAGENSLTGRATLYAALALAVYYAYYLVADAGRLLLGRPDLYQGTTLTPAHLSVYVLRPTIVLTYSLFFATIAGAIHLVLVKLYLDAFPPARSVWSAPTETAPGEAALPSAAGGPVDQG